MGFLDRFLKKETSKLVNSAVNGIIGEVSDALSSAVNSTGSSNAESGSKSSNSDAAPAASNAKGEKDCFGSEKVVAERIEKILAENYPGYTFRKNVAIADFGQKQYKTCVKHTVDYVISDGFNREKAAVMILSGGMENKMWTASLYRIFEERGLKHVHFLLHLPNRESYIAEQLKKVL